MDHADPGGNRLAGISEKDRFSIKQIGARIVLLHTGKHLVQRGLPGSVFTNQPQDLAADQGKIDAVQSVNTWEIFMDILGLNNVIHM